MGPSAAGMLRSNVRFPQRPAPRIIQAGKSLPPFATTRKVTKTSKRDGTATAGLCPPRPTGAGAGGQSVAIAPVSGATDR